MKRVLFVCVHNAGRSQMAEAFFNQMAKEKAKVFSAGTQPTDKVNPVVVVAMREVGIDIGRRKPKPLRLEMLDNIERVITMGCGADAVCPASFVPTEDWQLEDPEGKPIEIVRRIRYEIRAKVEELVRTLR